MAEKDDSHWSLDKRIPIALLLGIVASTITVGGTAVIAHHRLGVIEKDVALIESRMERDGQERRQYDREASSREASVNVALAELREATRALRETVAELRTAIRNQNGEGRR